MSLEAFFHAVVIGPPIALLGGLFLCDAIEKAFQKREDKRNGR